MLITHCPNPQIVSQLVECGAKTTGRLELFEPKHRVIPLLDSSMILLHSIVRILIVSMQDFTSDDPTNSFRIGRVFISCHP